MKNGILKALASLMFAALIMMPLSLLVSSGIYSPAGSAVASFLYQVASFLQFVFVMVTFSDEHTRREICSHLAWFAKPVRATSYWLVISAMVLCFFTCSIVTGILFTAVICTFRILLKRMLFRVQKT